MTLQSDALMDEELKRRRRQTKAVNDFDLKLEQGKIGERLVKHLLSDAGELTFEVKRDFWVSKSKHVAIEVENNGKPSGLAATKADYWAIVLDGDRYNSEIIVFIKTSRLKELVEGMPVQVGGNGNKSVFHRVRLDDLLDFRVKKGGKT